MYFRHLQGRPREWRPGEGWARVRVLAVVVADGQKLVFVGFSGEGEREFEQDIYVMNEDGTGVERVTRSRAYEASPSFFPDGQRIAFTSIRFTGQDGPAAGSQEDGAFTPEDLTPESLARGAAGSKETSAVPEESIEVSVINADGSGRENLTAGPAYDVLPAFSPSGDQIVFSKVTFDGRTERSDLFVMGSDGANKTQITDTPRAFEYEADWQPVLP